MVLLPMAYLLLRFSMWFNMVFVQNDVDFDRFHRGGSSYLDGFWSLSNLYVEVNVV